MQIQELKDKTKEHLIEEVEALRRQITELKKLETENKRVEESLRDSEERYRKLIQQSVEAIYMFDPETKRVFEANAAFLDFLGYTAEEIQTLALYDFVVHKRENIDAYVQQILMSGAITIGERVWRRKDKTLIDVRVTASKIQQGGRYICFVVARDITERKRAEEEIKKLNEKLRWRVVELEVINKELMTFSHSALDELGAPLRSIDGFSRVLLQDYAERLDEQGKDYLQRVRAATQSMAQLIDNLLNLSRAIHSELYQEQAERI